LNIEFGGQNNSPCFVIIKEILYREKKKIWTILVFGLTLKKKVRVFFKMEFSKKGNSKRLGLPNFFLKSPQKKFLGKKKNPLP